MECRTVSGKARGFTLIELLVVMSIIAVLLTIAVPRYFKTLERSRETVLRQDLNVMREAIDKHYGDYGQYPDSLAALVERKYIRAIPAEPITKSADAWQVVVSEDPDHPGIRDVHSMAEGNGSDGRPYKEW
ncbi:MAG: prepilin-type N-terminal cleavage/methylation domain-containing protein [Gammaproteobacteria bacterium]|nr:prepilin-type N-terminal cleavage/methylation domain-containing protein [Gammaproteobacteria bacterium]MDE2252424.1 prepilin-type N-terminal cleavage/methylation domain-containing protein [Gammaproteobacteria bacterium]